MTGIGTMLGVNVEGHQPLLNDMLNEIEANKTTPEEAALRMTPLDRRDAAIVHLSALLDADPSMVTDDHVTVGGLRVTLAPATTPVVPLWYDDLDAGFSVEGASLARSDGPRTMGQLLDLCQVARDRSDALLYLPQAERADRINRLVARTGASERFVRFLLSRFRSIRDEIAA